MILKILFHNFTQMHEAVFKALADPTRRSIIDVVAEQTNSTISSVCKNFKISRQAVTKHINILKEAGIIIMLKHGRQTQLYFNHKELKNLHEWLDKYSKFWSETADRLGDYLERND
jgi:DNA-binding transcriptional ArsR family regulator